MSKHYNICVTYVERYKLSRVYQFQINSFTCITIICFCSPVCHCLNMVQCIWSYFEIIQYIIDNIHLSCLICFADDLSYNKIATQSHTHVGIDNAAGNAVDRNTATCMRTQPMGHNSPDRTVWWKVDLGRVCNIYSINVIFRSWDGYGTCIYFCLRWVWFAR